MPSRILALCVISLFIHAACTNGRYFSGGAGGGEGGGGGGGGTAAGFPNNFVYAIALDSANGDVYVGGTFTQIGTESANRIAKYLADGTLDTNFTRGTGFDGIVHTLLLTNNQLYVGGGFHELRRAGGGRTGTAAHGRGLRYRL